MPARPIACTLLLASALLALVGCGAAPTPAVALMPTGFEPAARVARADRPPLPALDCDADGLIAPEELAAGFRLHQRAVTAEEFAAADLSRDGKWSEAEFSRFLEHRPVRAWSVSRPCAGK